MQREMEIRSALEQTKVLMDGIYRKQPAVWGYVKEMVLYPPATGGDIEAFYASDAGKRVPRSFASLLRAANGVDYGWDRICITGLMPEERQKAQEVITDVVQRHEKSFRLFQGDVTDENIAIWESKPKQMYLRRHCIVGTQKGGSLLVYDERTRQPDGEMELCYWDLAAPGVVSRYPNIAAFVESGLRSAQEYHAANIARKGKRTKAP